MHKVKPDVKQKMIKVLKILSLPRKILAEDRYLTALSDDYHK